MSFRKKTPPKLRSLSVNDLHPETKEEKHVDVIPESYYQDEITEFGKAQQEIVERDNGEQLTKKTPQPLPDFPFSNELQNTSPIFSLKRLDEKDQGGIEDSKPHAKAKKKRFRHNKNVDIEEQDEVMTEGMYASQNISENLKSGIEENQRSGRKIDSENHINSPKGGFDVNSLELISDKKHKKDHKKKATKDSTSRSEKFTKNQQRAMQQAAKADADGFDPARMIELPEWDLPPWAKKLFFAGCFVGVLVGLFIFGYFETDFTTDGQPKVVSIETRNERMYVNKSDELLQEVIDDASYIEDKTADMSDYITISGEIQQMYNSLNAHTTKLSKYTNVPASMEAYHTKLLNVSLGVQKLQKEIIQNYQNADYADWRVSNIASMNSSLDTLHDMRFQIDERIWGDSQ